MILFIYSFMIREYWKRFKVNQYIYITQKKDRLDVKRE